MQRLIDGYRRYRETRWPELRALHRYLAQRGQAPNFLVIACSDSRVDPATIFDMGPGELFVVRNVANLAPPFEEGAGYHGTSAAIEFAVEQLQVDTILVLGHAQCGGVRAALSGEPLAEGSFLGKWLELLKPAVARTKDCEHDRETEMERQSILLTIENLETFPFIRRAIAERGLKLAGARYGVSDGALEVLNSETGAFEPVL